MAEFEQVARDWKRMCKQYWSTRSCAGCPIAEHWLMYEYCKKHTPADIDFKKFEELVMIWAAKHPEPVYPTWMEWLTDVLAIPKAASWDESLVYDALQKHIAADIAKRLGIEPKRVTNDG